VCVDEWGRTSTYGRERLRMALFSKKSSIKENEERETKKAIACKLANGNISCDDRIKLQFYFQALANMGGGNCSRRILCKKKKLRRVGLSWQKMEKD
jgi:hypothetical protein